MKTFYVIQPCKSNQNPENLTKQRGNPDLHCESADSFYAYLVAVFL